MSDKEKFIPKFFGKKVNGKFKFNRGEENRYHAYMHKIKEDAEMFIAMGHKNKATVRSVQQNRYYWGVVVDLLAAYTGYLPEEMHEALKMLFLKDNTRKIPTLRSTTELTTIEFEDFLEGVRVWAASELNCIIPLPNEVDF